MRHSPPASTVSSDTASPSVRRRKSADAGDELVGVDRPAASSACWRENASSRLVKVAARCAPCSAISLARVDPRHRGRRRQVGQLPADHVEPAQHDGQQIVEVVRDAAGELADRFHLLRLAERFLGPLAGFVFGFELPRALLDRGFERLGEFAQLDQLALAVGDVDADADDADRLSGRVVEWQAPGVDPAHLVVARPDDPELELELARLVAKRRCDDIAQPHLVFAIDRGDPAVVAAVEIASSPYIARAVGDRRTVPAGTSQSITPTRPICSASASSSALSPGLNAARRYRSRPSRPGCVWLRDIARNFPNATCRGR